MDGIFRRLINHPALSQNSTSKGLKGMGILGFDTGLPLSLPFIAAAVGNIVYDGSELENDNNLIK